MKQKKTYLIDAQFSTDKELETTQDRQKAPIESKIVSIRSYVWLFLLDFRDSLLKLFMLGKWARTVSRELYWDKRVHIGLTSYDLLKVL